MDRIPCVSKTPSSKIQGIKITKIKSTTLTGLPVGKGEHQWETINMCEFSQETQNNPLFSNWQKVNVNEFYVEPGATNQLAWKYIGPPPVDFTSEETIRTSKLKLGFKCKPSLLLKQKTKTKEVQEKN